MRIGKRATGCKVQGMNGEMKEDQAGKFWVKNKMVGYIDEDDSQLYGISPLTGYRERVETEPGKPPRESLEQWLKQFSN